MNSLLARIVTSLLALGVILACSVSIVAAQGLTFSNELTKSQKKCLSLLLRSSGWKYLPQSYPQMMQIAQAATTVLNNKGQQNFVYVFRAPGWCGTGGCPVLIGEWQKDGACRLLYDDAGDTVFTVLSRRDHGYRRILTPCEARFNGRQYRQLHADCPSIDVRR